MSLQQVIDTAVSMEISRPSLVGQSVSRSGRLLTAVRNTVKPWRFTVEPKPVWLYEQYRTELESILQADRSQEVEITLGSNPRQDWIIKYLGSVPSLQFAYQGSAQFTVNALSQGTSLVLDVNEASPFTPLSAATVIFRAGDVIQPIGHRYPYAVSETVLRGTESTITVLVNRGLLQQQDYDIVGKGIQAGQHCRWQVKIAKLPQAQLISGRFMQFTDNFELIESVI
jgi:hypothetical protein